ncbi:MAG TPA: DUF4087 domain-containing protein [Allosphingosinicella sp.]|nr:DUF4087 domain-containing protein [Allosphingosinicella sp.]
MPAALAALCALSACSPEAAPPGNGQQARAEAAVAPVAERVEPPPASPAPVRIAAAPEGKRRCGWLSNPTPANWWLADAEGEWILGSQGAEQAPGMDEMPDMSAAGWVETNGHYGYGCACMTITADADGKVIRIADAQPKPLKQCQADRKLPKPE